MIPTETIKISARFAARLNELGFENERMDEIATKLRHSFVPVQRISNAMRESPHVGFNLIDQDQKQYFELLDPLNLVKSEYERFEVYQPILTDDINVEVGLKLKYARNSLGLTQQQVAEKVGMKRGDISNIEAGLRNITLDSLKRLADGLGVNVTVNIEKPE